ncbi:MAG: hypothetical protein MK066_15125 [Crocinitomicaceae bacterium]|nr:hypothetical protein [Crocinitomicaceae bacterium]
MAGSGAFSQLYLGSNTLGTPGTNEFIYTANSPFVINGLGLNNVGNLQHTFLNPDGMGVGIGVNPITGSMPTDVGLHIENRFFLIDGEHSSLLFDKFSANEGGQWGIEYQYDDVAEIGGLNFWKPWGSDDGSGSNGFGNHYLFLADNGNISIGTNDSKGYKFAVKGNMIAEAITVKLHADWPDFVFTDTYGLSPLSEVKGFIAQNGHLPNVPSAVEVQENGINLGEMDAILLQKIEELTLYMIQLSEENEALKQQINELSNTQN